jgi:hypothetical protein
MEKANLRKLLWFGVLAELCILLFSYFNSEFEISETFRLAARYSGRLSLFFFLATFLLTSLNWSSRRAEFKQNFVMLILIFSLLHFIHFVFLGLNVYLNEVELIPFKLLGGGFGYLTLLIYPWLLKSINPPAWLDYFYFYYLLLIMVVTILSRLSGAFEGAVPSPFHYIGLLAIFIVFMFHLIHVFKNK